MKLLAGMILVAIAHAIAFIQLQGQMKWEWVKSNPLVMMLLGLPISLMYIYTTRLFNEHFGNNWPGRLLGFGVGVVVFSIMSWFIFNENISTKTWICLLLATGIVVIQIFWKR